MATGIRMKGIEDAEIFAKERHKHQTRDDGKTPYWKHLKKVVENLKDLGITHDAILCAGWLHDTIEDTDTDYDDLDDEFGKEVADIVSTVTKDTRMIKKERETDYYNRLKSGSWQSQIVKFADMLANLEDLKNSKMPSSDMKNQAQNKLDYYDAIKTGLCDNRKNIPHLDSQISRLSDAFSKYGVRI
jgi:guanosine-3',5'-bis(diphosphate) 3'-pyrophosphohydrolase